METIRLSKTSSHKGIVTFTWDDNSKTHYQILAPIFEKYNSRCTFYINPGEKGFRKSHEDGYKMLSAHGFEMGSHGYTHHYFSTLSSKEFVQQLTNAREDILTMFGRVPTTFAFPHHDFDYPMLHNAKRFSLKTAASIDSVGEAIINAINEGYTLVFSGHGMIDPNISLESSGYEPISSEILSGILDLLSHYSELQIITFEQAAILSFLRLHCEIEESKVLITDDQLNYLGKFGLDAERIAELL